MTIFPLLIDSPSYIAATYNTCSVHMSIPAWIWWPMEIFSCVLYQKIQLYLICLDGGVEHDCSSLSFSSVWLVPTPEVEGKGPARSSVMVTSHRFETE